jgi:hypothetical protein
MIDYFLEAIDKIINLGEIHHKRILIINKQSINFHGPIMPKNNHCFNH